VFHKFQKVRQARTGHNIVKSSSPNKPSTWLIFLCPLCLSSLKDYAKTSESLTFISMRERKYTVNVQCSVQYTLFNVGNVLLFVIYQLHITVFMFTWISCFIYSARYYLWFHMTSVGLVPYYPQVQGYYYIIVTWKHVWKHYFSFSCLILMHSWHWLPILTTESISIFIQTLHNRVMLFLSVLTEIYSMR
jgi:hypothetical protein